MACVANVKLNPCFQRVGDGDGDGGRKIVYNTVGPNVCMGDHKVKTGLRSIFSILSEPSLQGPYSNPAGFSVLPGKRHFRPRFLGCVRALEDWAPTPLLR